MERRWLYLARSEFRLNKKRKHYSYLHKDIGSKRLNILITSKPVVVKHLDDGKVKRVKKTNVNKKVGYDSELNQSITDTIILTLIKRNCQLV